MRGLIFLLVLILIFISLINQSASLERELEVGVNVTGSEEIMVNEKNLGANLLANTKNELRSIKFNEISYLPLFILGIILAIFIFLLISRLVRKRKHIKAIAELKNKLLQDLKKKKKVTFSAKTKKEKK